MVKRHLRAEERLKAVLEYLQTDATQSQVAEKFGVGRNALARWLRLHKQGHSLAFDSSNKGRPCSITPQHQAWIDQQLQLPNQPSLAQITRELNSLHEANYTEAAVSRYAHRHGWKRKVKPRPKKKAAPKPKGTEFRYNASHRTEPDRTRRSYPSDLTDPQWDLLRPLLEKNFGRPRKHSLREVVNAVRYMARTGCQWRYLPHDFPPWNVVAKTYYRWLERGVWKKVNDSLREKVRLEVGKKIQPSAAIVDSQSIKTGEKGGSKGLMAARRSTDASDISW